MFGRKKKSAVENGAKNSTSSSVSNCSSCAGRGSKESCCGGKTTSRKGK